MCIEIIRQCEVCHWTQHFDWDECIKYMTRLERACKTGARPPKQEFCPDTVSEKKKRLTRPLSIWECKNDECPLQSRRDNARFCRKVDMIQQRESEEVLAEEEERRRSSFAEKYFKKVSLPQWAGHGAGSGIVRDAMLEGDEEKDR